MKAFFGGQIQEEYRGDLAAIVTRREKEQLYSIFLYPIGSNEFYHLTGVRSVRNPIERAYIGVSQKGGELVARSQDDLNRGQVNLNSIDGKLIISHFLRKQVELPQRLVLEAKQDGSYIVTEVE